MRDHRHHHARARMRAPGNCVLCQGSGRMPFRGNRFALWMIPCSDCHGTGRVH